MALLTEREAAAESKISQKTIRRLIDAGRLEAVNVAVGRERKKYRIDPAALGRILPPPAVAETPRQRRRAGRVRPQGTNIW